MNDPNGHPTPAPNQCDTTSLIRILAVTVVAAVLSFLVLWPTLIPSDTKFRVDSFTVSKLNVVSSSSFIGDFKVNLTVRNPNKKVSVSYDAIQALILHRDVPISLNILPSFTQPPNNETGLQVVFSPLLDTYVANNNQAVRFNLMITFIIGYKSTPWIPLKDPMTTVFCKDLSVGSVGNGANGTMSMLGGPHKCYICGIFKAC